MAFARAKADHGLEQAQPTHLDEVVSVDPSAGIPGRDAICEAETQQHGLLLQLVTLIDDVTAPEVRAGL